MRSWKKWAIVAAMTCVSFTSVEAMTTQAAAKNPTAFSSTLDSTPSAHDVTATQGMSLSSDQLGWAGPFSVGVNYDSSNHYFLNAAFAKRIIDSLAVGALTEYGFDRYRVGATLGFQTSVQSQLKFSAERFNQRLPFVFDSGNINHRVTQDAYGIDYQYNFLDNGHALKRINFGGYYANTPNIGLDSVSFLSDGINCSAAAGLYCVNDRNIAGARTKGMSIDGDVNLSSSTQLKTTANYDQVNYHTIYISNAADNAAGFGGGVGVTQLITGQMKIATNASVRKIYNTYSLSLSWLPACFATRGLELSLIGQRLISHNSMPNSNALGLQVNFVPTITHELGHYNLENNAVNTDLENFVKTPAVYMERVLAIADQQTRLQEPIANSVSPSSGVIEGGTEVVITGTNFLSSPLTVQSSTQLMAPIAPATTVTICGIAASSVSVVNYTTIKAITPAHASGVCDIVVSNSAGHSTFANAYTYAGSDELLAPTITGLSPDVGLPAGNTQVTISGAHFSNLSYVSFGDTQIDINSINMLSHNDTEIVVVSPAGSQPAEVTVTTTGGTSAAAIFTYTSAPVITSLGPTVGVPGGDTQVTISGTDFSHFSYVSFGGTQIDIHSPNFIAASDTQIVVLSPAGTHGTTVNVTVTTPLGTSAPASFTYQSIPAVTGVSPNSGDTSGGATIVITGAHFDEATAVNFGENSAGFSAISDTQIIATSPANLSGGFVDVTVTNSAGTSSLSSLDQFLYISIS